MNKLDMAGIAAFMLWYLAGLYFDWSSIVLALVAGSLLLARTVGRRMHRRRRHDHPPDRFRQAI